MKTKKRQADPIKGSLIEDKKRRSLNLFIQHHNIHYGEESHNRNFFYGLPACPRTIGILARHNRAVPYQTVSGLIFGTVYNITYQYDSNLKAEIEAELKRFDGSLSPFNDTATITRINRNEEIIPDTFFTNVFRRSMEISRETPRCF